MHQHINLRKLSQIVQKSSIHVFVKEHKIKGEGEFVLCEQRTTTTTKKSMIPLKIAKLPVLKVQ